MTRTCSARDAFKRSLVTRLELFQAHMFQFTSEFIFVHILCANCSPFGMGAI